MSPSHPDRVRKNYSICFERGEHNYFIQTNSNIAPFINSDGTRTTIRVCYDCGDRQSFTRTQEEFEKELIYYFPCERYTEHVIIDGKCFMCNRTEEQIKKETNG